MARAAEVRRIAEELDYRPHTAAVTLRGGRSGMVAVLGETPMRAEDDRTEERMILTELADLLNERLGSDLTFRLGVRNGGPFDLPPWKIDAAVVIGLATPEDLGPLERSGLPYVSINAEPGRRANTAAVLFDDHAAAGLAVDRLVGLGHRRIAFLNAAVGFTHRSVAERERGYLDAMAAHGLDPLPGHRQGEHGMEIETRELRGLRERHGATAFLTYEPQAAMSLYRCADELDIAIPRDLSVMTFNETYFGKRFLRPRLSCLLRPARPTAEAAVDLLAQLLAAPGDPARAEDADRTVLIPLRLTSTDSIAPPPAPGSP